ncbi:glycosyltransferase BC10 [Abrus precatorius]|uniref:Glycosyltransferase BC10 n=1 Tax=Abrus precatorius TaxID=3816 RepID=A0A8B8L5J3_ABRPR|nr:glycosyltransferase BC10 [Abrus precatorius]
MEHKPSQLVVMPFIGLLYRNLNNVCQLIFFIIGISLGVVATLCFLYPVTSPITTLPDLFPPPLPSSHPLSLTLPPQSPSLPLEVFSYSSGNYINSNSTRAWLNISLMHNMTDQELFLKATTVSKTRDFSNKAVPKVAFMFLAKGALPLAPLWEKFFKGHDAFYSIYLHQHPSFNETVPQDSVFYGRKVPSQAVFWGTTSMIDAERRLLANALMDLSNQRFVLLSESCIPLFGFRTIFDYLMNSSMSFLGSFDDPRRDARGRYSPKMWPTINLTNWRKGSQWFEVHRELAIHIVSDTKYYPIFQKYCHPPCYADEHYLPTFVHTMYPQLNSNRSLTLVDWSRRGPHPRTFGWHDITDESLNHVRFGSTCVYDGNPTNTCFLFARKFHPSALNPLLRVSPLLFGVDT